MNRKLIFINLLIALTLLFASCDKGDESGNIDKHISAPATVTEITNVSEDFSYVNERLVSFALEYILCFSETDDGLLLIGYDSEEKFGHGYEYIIHMKAMLFTKEGKLRSENGLVMPFGGLVWPLSADVDDAGNIWILYADSQNPTEPVYSVERYDSGGMHQESITPDLSGFDGSAKSITAVNDVESSFIISANNQERGYAAFYDAEGNLLFQVEGVKGLCRLHDGRVIIKRGSGGRTSFYEVDLKAGSMGREYGIDLELFTDYTPGNDEYEMLEVSFDAVYAYDLDNGRRVRLFDWVNQGVYYSYANRHVLIAAGDLYGLEVDEDTVSIIKFVKTGRTSETTAGSAATSDEREEVILAAIGHNPSVVKNTVVSFNKKSSDYKVTVKVYEDILAFDLDLVSGNIPDVIVLNAAISLDKYASKGLFADLYEFLDNDPDISRSDYVENVLKILETDGKLFGIPDTFLILTMIGRTSDVGTGVGWSWDDFISVMDSKSDKAVPAVKNPRVNDDVHISGWEFFNLLFLYSGSAFIDYEMMKCHFDTPAFISLLKTTKKYFTDEAKTEITIDDFREGNAFLISKFVDSFYCRNNTIFEQLYFDEEISYIGHPTIDGSCGSTFNFWDLFTISAKSENKEGAWAYLKYILTDYQYVHISGGEHSSKDKEGFPIKLSALEEYAKEAMNPFCCPDGRYVDYYGGIIIGNPSQEHIDKIFHLIDSITIRGDSLVGIYQIVEEEVQAFFSDQKSAEEVAAIIQNRCSLLMAEMD